ncbi:hypothetical protein ACSBR2_043156 [Camellia fascicularis]
MTTTTTTTMMGGERHGWVSTKRASRARLQPSLDAMNVKPMVAAEQLVFFTTGNSVEAHHAFEFRLVLFSLLSHICCVNLIFLVMVVVVIVVMVERTEMEKDLAYV